MYRLEFLLLQSSNSSYRKGALRFRFLYKSTVLVLVRVPFLPHSDSDSFAGLSFL